MEYAIAFGLIAAFAAFIVYKIRKSNKKKASPGAGGGGFPKDDNTNQYLK